MLQERTVISERVVNGGLLIAIEGIHGCGKTTQVDLLNQRLIEDRYSPVLTKEVAGTTLADEIYKIAFKEGGEAFEDPLIMTLLIAASRASRINKIIKPTIDKNGIVIADRYKSSMLVFQHYCQGVDEDLVRKLNESITQGIDADVTFVIDVEPEVARLRRLFRLEAEGKLTGWDAKDAEFHNKSREAFLKFANTESGWVVINGMKSPNAIAGEIYSKTAHLIQTKNGTGNT